MNPRRFSAFTVASSVMLASWAVGGLIAAVGKTAIENASAAYPVDVSSAASGEKSAELPPAEAIDARAADSNVAAAEPAVTGLVTDAGAAAQQAEPAVKIASIDPSAPPVATPSATPESVKGPDAAANLGDADAAREDVSVPPAVDAAAAAPEKPEPTVEMAAINPSEALPAETSPVEEAAKAPEGEPGGGAKSSIEIVDECLVVDPCIDRYLWALYERTPKEDSIKMVERRKVAIKRKGKMVTVTKSFTKLVDEDFAWKDPKAADRAGLSMMDYVIGGMDRNFKLKLFHILHAAEAAGLSPGITSAFRDNYRQSIASGLKAASNRSYHGGSLRGGYGHGLAADVVSVNGATRDQRWIASDRLWKWIDAHGKEFGIGRPYLDRDPPHLAPIDGQEYASHHHGSASKQARSEARKTKRIAARDDRSAAKRRMAKSSKQRAT